MVPFSKGQNVIHLRSNWSSIMTLQWIPTRFIKFNLVSGEKLNVKRLRFIIKIGNLCREFCRAFNSFLPSYRFLEVDIQRSPL